MAFLITTTGEENQITFVELGARSFLHPTVDHDLSLEFTKDELQSSATLQQSIDKGHITVKDEHGHQITQLFDVFGSNLFFERSDKTISTTSTRYVVVLKLDFNAAVSGQYRISSCCQYRYSGNKKIGCIASTLFDDDLIFENSISNINFGDDEDYIPVSFFDYVDVGPGSHVVTLEFALTIPEGVKVKKAVATIKGMKLEVWRIK